MWTQQGETEIAPYQHHIYCWTIPLLSKPLLSEMYPCAHPPKTISILSTLAVCSLILPLKKTSNLHLSTCQLRKYFISLSVLSSLSWISQEKHLKPDATCSARWKPQGQFYESRGWGYVSLLLRRPLFWLQGNTAHMASCANRQTHTHGHGLSQCCLSILLKIP